MNSQNMKMRNLNTPYGNSPLGTESLRIQPEEHAILVENVESAGWASLAGLRQGDLLLKVNGTEVRGIQQMSELMDQIHQAKPQRVVFFVKRGIHTLFIEIEPEWNPS